MSVRIICLWVVLVLGGASISLGQAETGVRFPEMSTRLLSREDVKGWSEAKLRYAISDLYARHGVNFEDREIKKWFLHFTWYHPYGEMSGDEQMLTDIEEKNVETLREAGCEQAEKTGDADAATGTGGETGQKSKKWVVSAAVVDNPPAIDNPDANHDYGNIEVHFADGHSGRWTKENHCDQPHVSNKGDVGWVYGNFSNPPPGPQRRTGKDVVVVCLTNGDRKKFRALADAPFIESWMFADRDSTVLIKSRSNHGPAAYIKYNKRTGRVLGRMYGYQPWDQMPMWAWPYGDD